jgi:hypothetical protein
MEAARTSETLVNFYQDCTGYNPEQSHLRNVIIGYKAGYKACWVWRIDD